MLIGGGHSHVQVLRSLRMRPLAGVRTTVITRELHTPYSGMLPGLIAGHYQFDDAHIDLGPLAQSAGARLIAAEVTGLDLDGACVHLRDRPPVRFDLLSINSGGAPSLGGIAANGAIIPVKPIGTFLPYWQALLCAWQNGELGARPRLAIVGGGAGGVELALSVVYALDRLGLPREVTLVAAGNDVLADHNPRVRRHFRRRLEAVGVAVRLGFEVTAFEDGRLRSDSGQALQTERVLWVTGVAAPAWPRQSGLAVDEAGFVRVDATLRSISHQQVFAAGDVAALDGQPRPKSGVYAVREGPTLINNLRRAAAGERLAAYRAQRRALALISEGERRAVASRGWLFAEGVWLWRVKNFIDRRFMARFEVPANVPDHLRDAEPMAAMRCGGCGAKLGADLLARVLRRLQVPDQADILQGVGDDAAVIATTSRTVATVDGFRAMIDDPYRFGRIAAQHALSDVFAMGAVPRVALALVSVPLMADTMMEDELYQVMAGACEVFRDSAVGLAGGHSAEAAELSLGFAVLGQAPEAPWQKGLLADGDRLLMTKPLGVGALMAGHMRGVAKSRDTQRAIESMERSNGAAADIFKKHGVHAATDVTGFGLLGHLAEMLRASGVGAEVDANAVPALPGALALIDAGIESTLAPSNARALDDFEIVGAPPTDARVRLLIDPQTSGGLLAGVAEPHVSACLAELEQAGYEVAVVGRIGSRSQVGGGVVRVD